MLHRKLGEILVNDSYQAVKQISWLPPHCGEILWRINEIIEFGKVVCPLHYEGFIGA